jgi:hypothetical protein
MLPFDVTRTRSDGTDERADLHRDPRPVTMPAPRAARNAIPIWRSTIARGL